MAKVLTDVSVRNLKPGPKRREVPDGGCRGLRLVIQPSGAKSYALRYRYRGRMTKLTFGDVALGLAAARKLAADALFELARGGDPAEGKRQARQAQAVALADSFRDIAERYMKLEGVKLRSVKSRQSILDRLVLPRLGDRPISAIRRSEISRLLDEVEIANGPVQARMTLAIIRTIMGWFAARSDDFVVPIVKAMGRARTSEQARDRILTDDELARVLKAAETAGVFGQLLRFLLLTGARRDEGTYLRWQELSNGAWVLPASRNKTGRELVRPLSKAAQEIIAQCPRIEGCEFVFSLNGRTAIGGLSRFKRKLDEASGTSNWTIHDLRRSCRSLMSRANVPSDHAERCLGHVIGGVRGVYDRHKFVAEMERAYEALASLLQRIISPPAEGKVIEMKRG
jgi:integrase